ncbi:MAG: RNA-binding transcriptional accessory protein [Thermosipho sp. (in: Bacteria)]|nr:RNA-binding transcriptional accessory protein [Thermosipho sp. (in: thermotogales)]
MDIINLVSKELNIKYWQVKNTLELLENNTVPFISRYRKEATGNLNEEQIREIKDRFNYYQKLENYKQTVLKSIDSQGKLTEELKNKILNCTKLSELENIYLPFKKRKKTKADIAIENGLEPLAKLLLFKKIDFNLEAKKFLNEKFDSIEKIEEGVSHIIGQWFAHDAKIRTKLLDYILKFGYIKTYKKKEFENTKTKYEIFTDFTQKLNKIPEYRILSIFRGENEGVLKVNIKLDEKFKNDLFNNYLTNWKENNKLILKGLEYGWNNMLYPSIENEVRKILKEKAEKRAIEIFSKNLKELLLTPPIKGKRILAIDPGYRTGCKVVVIDENGKFLEHKTIYPVPPHNDFENSEKIVLELIKKYDLNLIAIGNGTASRETQQFIAQLIKNHNLNIKYLFVNEAGASVYSASKLAKEEFPNLDVTIRGAISIGRRVLDPLAEFVKIDPKSLGVGQYQHDVNQKLLKEKLDNVVEDVVNHVGVNLNTASPKLLEYVSGITSKLSKKIVEYRETHGKFIERKELLKIKGLGEKIYQQCAGFLRIFDGANPLEMTGIHPENYETARKLLSIYGFNVFNIKEKENQIKNTMEKILSDEKKLTELSKELDIGIYTLKDIILDLIKPGRDPRDELPQPLLYDDILTFEDLKVGMRLQGTVTNITDFGAFVDIGIKESGLIHKSKLNGEIHINQIVDVEIIDIDKDLKHISLKMIN